MRHAKLYARDHRFAILGRQPLEGRIVPLQRLSTDGRLQGRNRLCTLSTNGSTILDINRLRRGPFLLASIAVLLGTGLTARVDAQTTYTYTVIADLYNCTSGLSAGAE